MTTSWGGTSLPDPTNITLQEDFVGSQYLVASGAMNTDQLKTALRFTVEWENITYAQFGTIYGKALTNASASLVLPIYGTITVIPIRGSLSSTPTGGAATTVNCSCQVRTVT